MPEPKELMEYKTDHDLLIEVRVLLSEMRRDMREMKDGMSSTLADHEKRIRDMEALQNSWIGKQSLIAGAIGIGAGLLGSFMQAGKL